MKKLLIIAIFLTATTAQAQTLSTPFSYQNKQSIRVSVSPYSIHIWGAYPATAKITARYKYIEITLLHTFTTRKGIVEGLGEKMNSKGTWVGLFVIPIQFEYNNFHLNTGIGWMFRPFPAQVGSQFNFTLQASYMITDNIGIGWSHISNGFGIWNKINPGVDNLSIILNI